MNTDEGIGPFGEPIEGAPMGQRRRWRFPSIAEGMVLADISAYAEAEYDQTIAPKSLKNYHTLGRGDFPAPAAVFSGRPVWARADIDAWLSTRQVGAGRPPARPATAPDLATIKTTAPELYEQLLAEARAAVEGEA